MSGSDVFRKLSVVVGVLGFALGIVLGAVLKTVSLDSLRDPVFNTSLMISVWLATAALVIALVAVFFHLRNQETMQEYLYEIVAKIKNEEKK